MSKRSRILGFGAALLLVVAGVVCAAVVPAGLGEELALVLIGLGVVAATSLVFYEVGLSEDRDRAREKRLADAKLGDAAPGGERPAAHERLAAGKQDPSAHSDGPEHVVGRGRPGSRRLDRMRGRPRRLR